MITQIGRVKYTGTDDALVIANKRNDDGISLVVIDEYASAFAVVLDKHQVQHLLKSKDTYLSVHSLNGCITTINHVESTVFLVYTSTANIADIETTIQYSDLVGLLED